MITLILTQVSSESSIGLDWWNAIKEVNDPYALLAFLAFASVTALLALLRFTNGLASAQEYLLKNAQLTGTQVEGLFKFTLLIFASVTIALLFSLTGNGWKNEKVSSTPISSPYVGITFPGEFENIEVDSGFSQFTLRGQSNDIPRSERLWVFSHPLEANRYFPFQSHASVEVDGDWSSSGRIGPIDKPNITYEFLVIGADEDALYLINNYLAKSNETQQYLGFSSLSDSFNIYSKREVTFTPKNKQ